MVTSVRCSAEKNASKSSSKLLITYMDETSIFYEPDTIDYTYKMCSVG